MPGKDLLLSFGGIARQRAAGCGPSSGLVGRGREYNREQALKLQLARGSPNPTRCGQRRHQLLCCKAATGFPGTSLRYRSCHEDASNTPSYLCAHRYPYLCLRSVFVVHLKLSFTWTPVAPRHSAADTLPRLSTENQASLRWNSCPETLKSSGGAAVPCPRSDGSETHIQLMGRRPCADMSTFPAGGGQLGIT